MTILPVDPVVGLLAIPAISAALLAILPGYRLTARLNVVAALLTFLVALSLFFERPAPGPYLLIDDLNVVFIVLTTFVAFTTSSTFGPTDSPVLTPWAKLFTMTQALISLTIVVLLISRAVGVL